MSDIPGGTRVSHHNRFSNWILHCYVDYGVTVNTHAVLTHWGRATHICVSEIIIIGSDNGLSPGRRQAIIWTNVGILLIGPLGINFSEILIEINTFSFKKMHLKMSSAKWRLFRLGLHVLTYVIFKSNYWRCCSFKYISNSMVWTWPGTSAFILYLIISHVWITKLLRHVSFGRFFNYHVHWMGFTCNLNLYYNCISYFTLVFLGKGKGKPILQSENKWAT